MLEVSLVQKISAWLMPVLLAITVHETAHGWVARRFGDKTAEMQGRLTLNPFKHIDPVGTILVPGLMLLLPGGFVFGWAKPVPVDWRNFKRPKQDMAWVAAAGPISNLLMAFAWALVARIATGLPVESWIKAPLLFMGVAGIFHQHDIDGSESAAVAAAGWRPRGDRAVAVTLMHTSLPASSLSVSLFYWRC